MWLSAGTTEGRELAELLADSNIKCSVCVATDYALELMNDKRLDVNCGRLTEEEMKEIVALNKNETYYHQTPELLKKYVEMVPPVDEQK